MKYSSGIIPFRINENGEMEFFLGHPGGNWWKGKSYWAYLKGRVEEGEDFVTTALREFKEESGLTLEDCESKMLIPLGTCLQNPRKTVIAYGLHYPNINPSVCHSNLVEDEDFPEIDDYRWLTYDEVKKYTNPKHIIFYEQLINLNNHA